VSASLDIVAIGVPLFAIAIAVESWIGRRRRRPIYHFPTALSDVACGAMYTALDVVLRVGTLAVYVWIFERFRVIDWAEGSPWPWILGLVGVDLGYYAWHRASHVVNALWAVHVVHHHSEDYNFAVALRQPLLEPVTWAPFFAALAVLGVPFEIYFVSFTANLFFQFWLHTELVGRLPAPVRWVFNTPSHHRVHHGIDAEYLDRNYGGVLIVWDRLFGTFTPERQAPTYGTTTRLHSFNPLWANLAHWHHIAWLWRYASGPADRLRALVAHPGWRPAGAPTPPGAKRARGQPKYRPALPISEQRRIGVGLALSLAVVAAQSVAGASLPLATNLAIAGAAIVSLAALTARAEQRPWAARIEIVRVLGLGASAAALAAIWLSPAWAAAVGLGTLVVAALAASRG
jgi:sterol desaturase/sphingolipid hydroxylase (fatty acid hydroxylase superfamily)